VRVDGGVEWGRLTRFGPFFAVDLDLDGRPLAELARPDVLRTRAAAVATALAAGLPPGHDVPARVAASVSQLGLCARLSAVALGAAVDGLTVPVPERWSYVDRLGGPYPVGLRRLPAAASAPDWVDVLLALVRPVAAATITTFALSPQVVWGNVASGLHGAARMITTADPGMAASAAARLAEVLDHDELRGTLTRAADGNLRRRSCCLIYRLSGSTSAVCGDCVLAG
jgi:hypothetical protein